MRPDLTCLGKIVGGGMPLALYGGRRDVMSQISPLGPVYQAGTLSGNPVAVSAALATLAELDRDSTPSSTGSVSPWAKAWNELCAIPRPRASSSASARC